MKIPTHPRVSITQMRYKLLALEAKKKGTSVKELVELKLKKAK